MFLSFFSFFCVFFWNLFSSELRLAHRRERLITMLCTCGDVVRSANEAVPDISLLLNGDVGAYDTVLNHAAVTNVNVVVNHRVGNLEIRTNP